ncbi:DivIVA domain-containing protein [Streptacidiphilus sp. ASG 303]|uniref:DivIVA domain-containing protein n=1 Tax=Streptacidiphilus sp. ASG 303 TaxID=2896847 RepID=UPI001E40C105|nr:DivIVA domain-containing protein [Streptacidiphilus sp. ASG 303]MCD0485672.1 DivIVA domain-containing protein [Streptacidiphilus sp. ASG 303]
MFWLIVAGMAVVVGVAALVALGAGGSMPEAVHDRLVPVLPRDRPLDRGDVDGLRLPMALRGYRMDEVDDVLDRLGAELALRDARIAELEAAAAGGRGSWSDQAGPASAPHAPASREDAPRPGGTTPGGPASGTPEDRA